MEGSTMPLESILSLGTKKEQKSNVYTESMAPIKEDVKE